MVFCYFSETKSWLYLQQAPSRLECDNIKVDINKANDRIINFILNNNEDINFYHPVLILDMVTNWRVG